MIRLLNIELNTKKNIYIALTSIYGIGISKSLTLLKQIQIDPLIKTENLTKNQVRDLRGIISADKNLLLEGNLKRSIELKKSLLIEIKSVKGLRLLKGLPIHGQRTRTNRNTAKKQKFIYS